MARKNRRPASPRAGAPPPSESKPRPPKKGILRETRELWDTLVLAFVLVTLMKTFVVDLYKIPSGSMTPTLIGDWTTRRDYNHDGRDDLILFRPADPGLREFEATQVFLRGADGSLRCDTDALRDPTRINLRVPRAAVHMRSDRILVNKMWYWFAPLARGNIVVFKLPWREDPRYTDGRMLFDPLTPFYIKRAAAMAGETPTIDDAGHLLIDGKIIAEPLIYAENHYFNTNVLYARTPSGRLVNIGTEPLPFLGTTVPPGQFYVFGDNSGNSADSRYWGGVPIDRLRGRAFFRYWPLWHIGFLH
jgi:signal peptidase I